MKTVQIVLLSGIMSFCAAGSVSDVLNVRDSFTAELEAADEFCQPPASSLINVYGGIANSIRTNDDAERLQSSQVDWSLLLSPAPSAIAIMGNLLLVTANRDVSISASAPEGGWVYVKHPNSLKASIVQVGGEAYRALLTAHSNMDRIKLQTGNVPIYFKQVVKLLTRGKPKEKRVMLPISIGNIERVAAECSHLANQTAQQFQSVSLLIEELLLGCVGQAALSTDELDAVKIRLASTKATARKAAEDVTRFQKAADKADDRLDDTFDKLQEAIDDAPTGLELFGAAVADVAIGAARMLTFQFGDKGGQVSQSGEGGGANTQNQGTQGAEKMAFQALVSEGLFTHQYIPMNLLKKLENSQLDHSKTEATKLKETLGNLIRQLGSYKQMPANLTGSSRVLAQQGQTICDHIVQKSKPSLGQANDTDFAPIPDESYNWSVDVGALKQRLGNSLGLDTLPPVSPPEQGQVQHNSDGSIAGGMMASWRNKVANQQAMLTQVQANYEFQQERLDKANEKSAQLIARLTELNMTQENLKEAIEVLSKAIEHLAELQEQWRFIERFFRQISHIISDKWRRRLDDFTVGVRAILDNNGIEEGFDVGTDMLYKTAFRATSFNYRIFRLASTYVQVSDVHFLPPLAKMNGLLAIDPAENKAEFLSKRAELNNDLKNAQNDIQRLIIEDRNTLANGIIMYREKLQEDFKALCPPDEADEEVLNEIAVKAVEKGNQQEPFDFDGF